MKYIILAGIVLVPVLLINNYAYAAFDANGNYYCNPNNLDLEKTIYKAAVNSLDFELQEYLDSNPSVPAQKLHDFVLKSSSGTVEPTYDIMNKARSCLESNGIPPLSIAIPSSYVMMVAAIPEFGPIASLIVIMSLSGVILIHKITRFQTAI